MSSYVYFREQAYIQACCNCFKKLNRDRGGYANYEVCECSTSTESILNRTYRS